MINVTSSVVLNDFLKRYLAKQFPEKRLVRLGQVASLGAITLGFLFSLGFRDVVSAWETMIFVVVTMILAPATMRWHWWRFGARAFVWSMASSAAFIVLQKVCFGHWSISLTLSVDVLASVVLTLLFGALLKPADMEVLVKFYSRVRPFGFWGPVRAEAVKRGLVPARDIMPRMDVLNAFITALFQLALALVPFYLFLHRWPQLWFWLLLLAVLGVVLYFTWFKNLPGKEEV
jgi:SSS family solute:Na+ symporter